MHSQMTNEEKSTKARNEVYTYADLYTNCISKMPHQYDLQFYCLANIARSKNVHGATHWRDTDITDQDVQWAVQNILLHQQVIQQKQKVPNYTREELEQFHMETLRYIGYLRNIKGYAVWANKEQAMTSIQINQGNLPRREMLMEETMKNLKDIGRHLGIPTTQTKTWVKANKDQIVDFILQRETSGVPPPRSPIVPTNVYFTKEMLEAESTMAALKKIGKRFQVSGYSTWKLADRARAIAAILKAQDEARGVPTASPAGSVPLVPEPGTSVTVKMDVRVLQKLTLPVLKDIADGYGLVYDSSPKAKGVRTVLIQKITEASRIVSQEQVHVEEVKSIPTEDVHASCTAKINELQQELTLMRQAFTRKEDELKQAVAQVNPAMFQPMYSAASPVQKEEEEEEEEEKKSVEVSVERGGGGETVLDTSRVSQLTPVTTPVVVEVPNPLEGFKSERFKRVAMLHIQGEDLPSAQKLFDGDGDEDAFDSTSQTIRKCLGVVEDIRPVPKSAIRFQLVEQKTRQAGE